MSDRLARKHPRQTDLPADSWEWWHTAALGLILALLGWMAVYRPWGLYASWLVVVGALVGFIVIAGLGITASGVEHSSTSAT